MADLSGARSRLYHAAYCSIKLGLCHVYIWLPTITHFVNTLYILYRYLKISWHILYMVYTLKAHPHTCQQRRFYNLRKTNVIRQKLYGHLFGDTQAFVNCNHVRTIRNISMRFPRADIHSDTRVLCVLALHLLTSIISRLIKGTLNSWNKLRAFVMNAFP